MSEERPRISTILRNLTEMVEAHPSSAPETKPDDMLGVDSGPDRPADSDPIPL